MEVFRRVKAALTGTVDVPMGILTGLVFLLPLFFIPFSPVPVSSAKMFFFGFSVLIVFSFLLLRGLRKGELLLPTAPVTIVALLIPFFYLGSALMAPAPLVSLFGQGFETDTVFTILLLFLLFFLALFACRSKGNVAYALVALLGAFVLLALFHFLRLVAGPEIFTFSIFFERSATVLGTWNDLGIFAGLIILFSWFTLEHLFLKRPLKVAMGVVLAVALLLLAVVNFILVWIVLGFIASLFVGYTVTSRRFDWRTITFLPQGAVPAERRIPYISVVVLVVSAIFILDSYSVTLLNRNTTVLGSFIAERLHIAQLEARPSWKTTMDIAQETYKVSSQKILGTGPNTFAHEWLLLKPESINQTIFWNTSFAFGGGFIPTSFITVGILGGVAWLLFFAAFLWLGSRVFIAAREDLLARYLTLTTFTLATYLWIFSVLYVPGIVLLAYAALFSGLFVALAYQLEILIPKKIVFLERPRFGFALSLFLIVLLIASVTGVYTLGKQLVASAYFGRSVTALNSQDLENADRLVTHAIALSRGDQYEQLAAQIQITRVGALLTENQNPTAEEQNELKRLIETAVGHAIAATAYNERNYYNWVTLGQVYEALARLNVAGAYENAIAAYERAEKRNPTTPAVLLARARLEATAKNYTGARAFIAKALERKSDYTAASVLLAQIEIATGDTKKAIRSLESAAVSSPNNPLIFFQLGFMEYSSGSLARAIPALERAVALDTDYSNARYFLGLSYYRVGRASDAIAQFERVEELNPDNAEVQQILDNLRAGKSPITGKLPPEKRSRPPFDE